MYNRCGNGDRVMMLREYLFKNNLKISEFALIIDYSRNHLNQVVIQNKKPGKKMAKAIEKATEGKVTVKELMSVKKEKNL